MTEREIEDLVERLFTIGGSEEKAERLWLVSKNARYLGGWSRAGLAGQIRDALAAAEKGQG